MAEQLVSLYRSATLEPGHLRLPGTGAKTEHSLRFGSVEVMSTCAGKAPPGEAHLAADLWDRLAIPYDGIRLTLRQAAPDQLELGPAVAVLYPGRERVPLREMCDRAVLYYGHLCSAPGLLAFGFDEEIDWERRRARGWVLDNRPGREGELLRSWYPIPAAVRLTWSIRRDVIDHLREITANRTFNWVRSIGKWQFHTLLSDHETLRHHLPETRLLSGPPDLAAMLIRHESLFVKHVHGVKGQRAARIRRTASGFELCHVAEGEQHCLLFPTLQEMWPVLRQVTGEGRCVVQQGIAITGRQGAPLHFRILPVRGPGGRWRLLVATACVSQTKGAVFTNLANGALDQPVLESLETHCGMRSDEAHRCMDEMVSLCLTAAEVLESAFHPLGLLGFDVLVEAETRRIWLLEANAVPGWGYPEETETELARSQTDLALALAGFARSEEVYPGDHHPAP